MEQETRYSSNGVKELISAYRLFTTSLIIDAHGSIQDLSATASIYRLNRHADVTYPETSKDETRDLSCRTHAFIDWEERNGSWSIPRTNPAFHDKLSITPICSRTIKSKR